MAFPYAEAIAISAQSHRGSEMDERQETRQAEGTGFEDPRFLRAALSDTRLAWLWLVLRVSLGWLWFEAGRRQLQDPIGLAVSHDPWTAQAVAVGQTLTGIALILGVFVGFAAFAGGVLGIPASAGVETPALFAAVVWLVLAWKTAGWIGLDRWILPLLGMPWRGGALLGDRAKRGRSKGARRQQWTGQEPS
jgi:thiosulfate dehydrogenase [quinone] large subunit